MKKFFVMSAVLLMVCFCPDDMSAQSRREKKASKKATVENRGVQLVREECEELAIDINAVNPRAAGNGTSRNEAMATNIAMLEARSNLSQQLQVMVNGMLETFIQQYDSDGQSSFEQKSTQVQSAYFEKLLSNTRVIRKNVYIKDDGSFNVYVCIEADPNLADNIYTQLQNDKILELDVREDMFKQQMEAARKLYLENLDKQ